MPLFTVGEVLSASLINKVQMTPRPVSGSGTISAVDGDHTIVSSGNTPITLPPPTSQTKIKVTNCGTGTPVVSHNASEVIYGLGCTTSGVSSISLGAPGATVTLDADGTSWYITAGMQDSGWLALSGLFVNSWTTNQGTPGYRLQGNRVCLRGMVSGGATGSTAFTLPSGYRPGSADAPFFGAGVSGVSAYPGSGGLFMEITSAGLASITFGAGTLNFFGLDGLSFAVD